MRQTFIIAMKNLAANKTRCVQMLLGMVIGVAAVVMILSVQQGMINQIDAAFAQYSPSLMFMGTYRPVDSSQNFTEDDMARVAAEHPEYITVVSPIVYLPMEPVRAGGNSFDEFAVNGVNERFMEMSPVMEIAEGRFLQPLEVSREQNVCVISQTLAGAAFGGDALGQNLRILGQNFTVVGVMADVENDQEDFNLDIFIPYTVAKKLQPETPKTMVDGSQCYMSTYYVNANGMENIANARITVNEALKEVYGENAWHYSASFRYMREGEMRPIYAATGKMLFAAAVVLLVGGVGIMNVMLAAVSERRQEIGVRKAFGARQQDIRRQFILETASVSLVGGLLGVALGIVGSFAAAAVLDLPLQLLDMRVIALPSLLALAVALAVGVLFGYLPAKEAAKMEIVDSLRD